MKIKDIIKEGFISSFTKELLPKGIKAAVNKQSSNIPVTDLAVQAYKQFGDNPESEYSGSIGWLPPSQLKSLIDFKAKQGKIADKNKKKELLRKMQQQGGSVDSDSTMSSEPTKKAAPSSIIANKFKSAISAAPSATPPPQVTMSSGEIMTKYNGSWYNEQGQQVVDAASIASLERRAQKPSGQAQMAQTKNIPVELPGYKGKRR